jgi:circadian clock protein KaiC
MTDAIIELGFVEIRGEVRRWLTVVKVRGSRHDQSIREYRIGDDGMALLEPLEELTGLFT